MQGQTFTLCGTWNIERSQLAGVDAVLDALVGEVPRGVVPDEVALARADVAQALRAWWERLWYVIELRADAPG